MFVMEGEVQEMSHVIYRQKHTSNNTAKIWYKKWFDAATALQSKAQSHRKIQAYKHKNQLQVMIYQFPAINTKYID